MIPIYHLQLQVPSFASKINYITSLKMFRTYPLFRPLESSSNCQWVHESERGYISTDNTRSELKLGGILASLKYIMQNFLVQRRNIYSISSF